MKDYLVSTEWLDAHRNDPGVVVLDCIWYVPEAGKSGADEFKREHIPGARFFDLDAVSDKSSSYVNMLPPAEQFARQVGALGIGNDTSVIVYDSSYVSARVWWMFRAFGHQDVRVLDGGLRKWKAEGRSTASGEAAAVAPKDFKPAQQAGRVAAWQDVLAALQSGSASVVDARTAERFTGEMPSGYPGVPGGHMPGAVNVPWNRMIAQSREYRFSEPEQIERMLREAGVDLDKPIITTCGSGVTACVIGFMLERLGRTDWRLYDGSWHEWGQRPDLPKQSV